MFRSTMRYQQTKTDTKLSSHASILNYEKATTYNENTNSGKEGICVKKRFIIRISGIGILLVSFLLICWIKIRSNEQEAWEQQNSQESQEQFSEGQSESEQQNQQTFVEAEENVTSQEETLIEKEIMWKDAYINFIYNIPKGLEELEDPYDFRRLANDSDTEYWLYLGIHDFDGNDIPELIMGDGASIGIFTYENNALTKITDLYMQDHWGAINGVHFWDNSIILESDGSDGSGFVGLTYKDGEYISGNYCQYHPAETMLNNKKVTYEEFCEVFIAFTSDGEVGNPYSLNKMHLVKDGDTWFWLTKEEKRIFDNVIDYISYNMKDIEIVPAQVQVHKSWYRDERQQPEEFLGPRSESKLIFCVVFVESVTENSFTFDVREVVYSTGEVTEFISDATAYFIEDGKKAVYYGEDTTLYFWFGDDQIDPIIGCMTITGMEKLENIRYLNTDIPGHEAN